MRRIVFACLLIGAMGGHAQTKVDLTKQARNVDFSQATSTRPMKTGVSLPATCTTGEFFFKTDAAAGSNVYGCSATNTWSLQGTGESGIFPTPGMVMVDSHTLQLGGNCSVTQPCKVRFANNVTSFTQGATVSITAGTGTAYFYVTPAGVLVAGHSMTVSCTSGCMAQSGVTGFPADSIPLYVWTATSGAWNTQGTDTRSTLSAQSLIAGVGMTKTQVAGQITMGVDAGVVGLRLAAPASATATCQPGAWAMDGSYYYVCVGVNAWRRTGLSAW
jgi:hypothetical protein